jgi:hypothetical protein
MRLGYVEVRQSYLQPTNLSFGYLSISTHHTVPFCLVCLCRFMRVSSSAKLKDADHRSNRSTLPRRFADLPPTRYELLLK